jgi:hypothetical protein
MEAPISVLATNWSQELGRVVASDPWPRKNVYLRGYILDHLRMAHNSASWVFGVLVGTCIVSKG